METLDTDISCYLKNKKPDTYEGNTDLDVQDSDLDNLYHVNISLGGHSSQEKFKEKYFGQLSKEVMKKL